MSNKLFGDKMNYFEWQNGYEMKYNVMPAWWWNDYMRKKAYKDYLGDMEQDNTNVD
tara:strand:- start:376 stop:543 length:168 start_codon:yes stop_codon:yes gene_type:complete